MEKKECNHWLCNGCDKCGGWKNNPDVEIACINNSCECHSVCDVCKKCNGDCHFQAPYGFVPSADCPLHDSMSEEDRLKVVENCKEGLEILLKK